MAVTDLVGVHSLNDVREKLLNGVWDTWADPTVFVEDVFSTALYTGNGTTQTVTTGIDLAGAGTGSLMQGGITWIKRRNASDNNIIFDTARGSSSIFITNGTAAPTSPAFMTADYVNNGVTIGANSSINGSGSQFVAWNFRRAKKFLDIITYTGDGASSKTIAHSLGVVPGMMLIKCISTTGAPTVYHRANGPTSALLMNQSTGRITASNYWNDTAPTQTAFTVGLSLNSSGHQYVAYMFGHDTTADGIIQCGSFTGNELAAGPVVNLGWEPQYVMLVNSYFGSTTAFNWHVIDNMRGINTNGVDAYLYPNSNIAEASSEIVDLTSTGFQIKTSSPELNANSTIVYMAIRKGPMRVPTDATKVFMPVAATSSTALNNLYDPAVPSDMFMFRGSRSATANTCVVDMLRGIPVGTSGSPLLKTNTIEAETVPTSVPYATRTETTTPGPVISLYMSSTVLTNVYYSFKRAPGFFDQVCYTGNGISGTQIAHNLKAVPTMMWVKGRGSTNPWMIYHAALGNTKILNFDSTVGSSSAIYWNTTTPTNSVFTLGTSSYGNTASATYTAYLFGDVDGVSKAFSYTGNGTNQTIETGFNPRFVMIKRTDAAGDWFMWDSARGIIAGNDPHVRLNSTAAEGTDDSVDPTSPTTTGFIVNQTAVTNINAITGTGGTTWTARTSAFSTVNDSNNFVNKFAYGNGLFMAITEGNAVNTSPDGITWTNRTTSFGANKIRGITYGNNLFVAVGGTRLDVTTATSAIYTSSDNGVTWTIRSQPFGSNMVNAVIYANNMFVAASDTGDICTSVDGIAWTYRADESYGISDIAYGPGGFVAVGNDSNSPYIGTSPNAITWTYRTNAFPNGQYPNSVAYGNGVYVVVGNGGNINTSSDGITWVSQTSTFGTANIGSITFGNGLFVAISTINNRIATSPDGITWTTSTTSFSGGSVRSIGYGNGVYVAGGSQGAINTSNATYIGATYIGYAIA